MSKEVAKRCLQIGVFAPRIGPHSRLQISLPNCVKQLRDNKFYHWLTGDSGQKLGDEQFYSTLPVPSVPFGIIAGTESYTGLFSGPSDGVVLVKNTKLHGMTDWVAAPPRTYLHQ